MICTLHPIFSGDQIEKNEMGRVCSMYGEIRSLYRILMGKHEGKNHLEDQGVDGRIILRCIFRKWDVRAWIGSIWLRIWAGGRNL